jgi:hypothetical protein
LSYLEVYHKNVNELKSSDFSHRCSKIQQIPNKCHIFCKKLKQDAGIARNKGTGLIGKPPKTYVFGV